MRRRDLVLGSMACAVLSHGVAAQERRISKIGFLNSSEPNGPWRQDLETFSAKLRDLDLVEGKTIQVLYRWGMQNPANLEHLATDLVDQKVDVIVTTGGNAVAAAARNATSTIPIIFLIAGSPQETQLVQSINHPEGNLTGVALLADLLLAKRAELLHSMILDNSSIGVLLNAQNRVAAARVSVDIPNAAKSINRDIRVYLASGKDGIEPCIDQAIGEGVRHLVVQNDVIFYNNIEELGALASRLPITLNYEWRIGAQFGGLFSYGPSRSNAFQRLAEMTAKVIRGASVADLPVETPRSLELVVNTRVARNAGLTFPPALLTLADEVIE